MEEKRPMAGFIVKAMPRTSESIEKIVEKIKEYFPTPDKYSRVRMNKNASVFLNAAKIMYDGSLLFVISGYDVYFDYIFSFLNSISELAEFEVTLSKDSLEFLE